MKAFIWIVRILLALVLLVLLVAGGALLYSSSVKQESPPTLLGYAPFTVANGEMTPSLYPGDLAILRMGSQCQPGDIVAFQQDGELLLRRIVGTSEGMYITQQEAFGQPDVNLLDPARVVAVCITFLPGCGALAAFLYSPAGLAVLVVLGLALLLVPILLSRGTARLEGPLVDYGGEDPYEAPVSRRPREQARFAEDEEEAPPPRRESIPPRRESIPPRREGIPPRQESTAQEKPLIAMLEESPAEQPARPLPSRQEGASPRQERPAPRRGGGHYKPRH